MTRQSSTRNGVGISPAAQRVSGLRGLRLSDRLTTLEHMFEFYPDDLLDEAPLPSWDGWDCPDESLTCPPDDDVDDGYVPNYGEHLARAASAPAGQRMWHELEQVCPGLLDADDAVTYLQQMDRLLAHVTALREQAVAIVTGVVAREFSREPQSPFVDAHELVHAELTAACRVHRSTMTARIGHALDLSGYWRPMQDALLAGELSMEHVKAIGRALQGAPGYGSQDPQESARYAATCREVLAVVIPFARTHTPGECRRRAERAILVQDPAGSERRRREVAESQHGVYLQPGDEPGTAEIIAVLPRAHAHAIFAAVDALARDPRFETAAGCVTLGQRRVAALATLVLGDPGSVAVIDSVVSEVKLRASIDVVVPLATVLGASEQGAVVAGHDVSADAVRELLADCDAASTLRRLVTDTVDGIETVIDLGRTRYAVSDLQRRLLSLRDRVCRHPGCTIRASRCEIDHARPWREGGHTSGCNLGPLCKWHHQLKTHAGWQITSSSRSGACTWRSPLGRIYEHRPRPLLPERPSAPRAPVDTGPPPF